MRTRQRLAAFALAPAAALMIVATGPGSAQAATTAVRGATAAALVAPLATPAPECVVITIWTNNLLLQKNYKATNTCKTQQRVKLRIAWAFDTGCWVINPGKSNQDYRGPQSFLEGVDRC